MRLFPRPPVIGPEDGFTPENDIFGYMKFGEQIANLVGSLDQPVTLLLDGPWGSGKSTFVRQWAGHLRKQGACVIEFNAFENDHHEDAFIVIAAEIISAAKDRLDNGDSRVEGFLETGKKVGLSLVPLAAKIALKVATLGLLSMDDVNEAGEAVTGVVKEVGDDIADSAEKQIEERLVRAKEERILLETFRSRLGDLSRAIRNDDGEGESDAFKYPLVFIIDDLDRCRPPFAISVMETIKHLFNVDGVCFFIVTNIDQLSQSVQGAYGSGTNGRQYLEKFYDLRITMPTEDHQKNRHDGSIRRFVNYLWSSMKIQTGDNSSDELVRDFIIDASQNASLSFRTIERIATHVALTYAALGPRTLTLAPLIAGLAMMRQCHPVEYEKARNGSLNWEDVIKLFKFDDWPDDNGQWHKKWWRFFTDIDLHEDEIAEMSNSLRRFSFGDRFTLVLWGAKMVDSISLPQKVSPTVQ